MKFRTELAVQKADKKITLGHSMVTMGSCFANTMAQKLSSNKFSTLANPVGILYDPHSIARILTYAITNTRPPATTYTEFQQQHLNLLVHSAMNGTSKKEVERAINDALNKLHASLKTANWLILTFGTSWVYTHTKQGIQVANCHKIPQKEFTKSLLTSAQTQPVFDTLLNLLSSFNPKLNIVLTVSPVRHTKDTLPLNNLSKAHLLVLSHYLANKYANVSYYPAYELLLDDLRDYRFYKEDLLHPSEQAIAYIWQHFTQSYFNKETLTFIKAWGKIAKALQHKPFNKETSEHQKFIKSTLQKLKSLPSGIDVSQEINNLKAQLN